MMDAMLQAGAELAEALEAENAALRSMDLSRAVAGFARKVACAQRLRLALGQPGLPLTDPPAADMSAPDRRDIARACAVRLQGLAEDNRRLLERAMFVQGRLIATIARAVPTPRVGYGDATGRYARVSVRPMTLSARA